MLGKLIKHEWKSVSKVGGLILLAVLAVTVLGCLLIQIPILSDVFADESELKDVQSVIMVFTLILSFMLYVFMLVGASYGMMIYLGVRFYKTMYSSQGYLTHTLPVTPNQLLVSKTFVGGIWYAFVSVGVGLSVITLLCAFIAGIVGPLEGETFTSLMAEMFRELQMGLGTEYGGFIVHYIVYMLLAIILGPICVTVMIYGAMTIGQLSKKHKGVMGVLAYFGINMIYMAVGTIVQMVYTIGTTVTTIQDPDAASGMEMLGMYDSTLIIQVIFAVFLYWLSHYILTNKLNLE